MLDTASDFITDFVSPVYIHELEDEVQCGRDLWSCYVNLGVSRDIFLGSE